MLCVNAQTVYPEAHLLLERLQQVLVDGWAPGTTVRDPGAHHQTHLRHCINTILELMSEGKVGTMQ